MWRWLRWVAAGAAALLLAAQFVPYGRAHDNPPIIAEPEWDSAATRALAVRACFDCHSNETRWPWYSNVAPMSWLIQRDVDEGREELNWSEWTPQRAEDEEEYSEVLLEGSMPPWTFEVLHGEARLSDAEIDALLAGFRATFGR